MKKNKDKDNKYLIERSKEKESKAEQSDLSAYQNTRKLELTEEQIKRLKEEVFNLFEIYKQEREELELGDYGNYDNFCKSMDNQYRGVLPRLAGRQYNVDTRITMVKVDDVVTSFMEAIFGVDPNFSITPRPGFALTNGTEICQKQEDFLDYALDSVIPLRRVLRLVAQSACLKKVGILKLIHKIKKKRRIRQEQYKAELVEEIDDTGRRNVINKGIVNFIETHRDEFKKNPGKYGWVIKELSAGKDVVLDVEYDEIIYNDPYPLYVKPENFFVQKDVEDLEEAEITIERVEYTWYQLKKMELEFDFINVDKLLYQNEEQEEQGEIDKDAKKKKHVILECVYNFKINEDDDNFERIIVYFAEEREIYLGGIYWPLSILDCYYYTFYAEPNAEGFYKGSIGEKISAPHIASNAILNLSLEGVHIQSTVTPITPADSDVDAQLLEHRWIHGVPLHAKPGEIDFLNKYMPPVDLNGLMGLKNVTDKIVDDVSRVSSLRTGRESPLDPTAPATKVMALMQATDKGVKDYISELAKGVNELAQGILKMYYIISQNDQQFINKRIKDVTGDKERIFTSISRQEMVAKTLIQSQAHSYNFDKLQEKRENLAIYQIIRQELLIANNPEAVHYLLTALIKSWSSQWKNVINKILPSMHELKQQQLRMAIDAVIAYMDNVVNEIKITGVQKEIDPNQLLAVINQYQTMLVNPPTKEELKT